MPRTPSSGGGTSNITMSSAWSASTVSRSPACTASAQRSISDLTIDGYASGEDAPGYFGFVTFTEQEAAHCSVTERGYPSTDVRDAFLRDGTSTGLSYFERSLPLRPPAAGPDT